MRTLNLMLFVAVVLLVTSCNSEVAREKEEEARREAGRTKLKNDLAAKFGASTDWDKNLKDRLMPYSIDVEEALIRSDKRPILVEAFVEDVTRDKEKYVARLSYLEPPKIYFFLDCTPELATKLRSREGFDRVAVIASISSVRKPNIKLESDLPSSPDESPDVEVTSSDAFIAKGSMLDLEFIE